MSKGNLKGMSDKGIPPELFKSTKIKKGEEMLKLRLSRGGTKKKTSL